MPLQGGFTPLLPLYFPICKSPPVLPCTQLALSTAMECHASGGAASAERLPTDLFCSLPALAEHTHTRGSHEGSQVDQVCAGTALLAPLDATGKIFIKRAERLQAHNHPLFPNHTCTGTSNTAPSSLTVFLQVPPHKCKHESQKTERHLAAAGTSCTYLP